MNKKFDEFAKGMAQSVTRRQALKKFGVGLAGMALACFGVTNIAKAAKTCLETGARCGNDNQCCSGICFGYIGYGGNPGNDHPNGGKKLPKFCQ